MNRFKGWIDANGWIDKFNNDFNGWIKANGWIDAKKDE